MEQCGSVPPIHFHLVKDSSYGQEQGIWEMGWKKMGHFFKSTVQVRYWSGAPSFRWMGDRFHPLIGTWLP
ncbi:Uncharacterized protein TCM_029971 [Theobroma cacao]|uniref:Uncharacterized protein n=1 Tax=Theobroma cacao TaxID=3641 RepID=A0A061GGV2_THECC|nr:Uncharacterized protein TCM_029971 [Theobroma cacao]